MFFSNAYFNSIKHVNMKEEQNTLIKELVLVLMFLYFFSFFIIAKLSE